MTKLLLLTLSALALFINADCKKDIVEPPVDDVKPGSRNYKWTVDTVYAPFNPFSSISGTSPTDLWTANPGDGEKIFYHYDGIKWTTDLIPRIFSPLAIFSITPQNVWSCGYQGKIWHFKDNQWSEHCTFFIDTSKPVFLLDIYYISGNNIYAVGEYFDNKDTWGIILHYNGTSWKQINIPQIRTAFIKIRKNTNGKLYLLGVTNEQFTESTYQLYEFDGATIQQIKSGSQNNDQLGGILELGNQIYFVIGFDFYNFANNTFTKIGRLSELPEFLNVGFGRTTKDIFLGMRNGIAHYNGTDTQYLVKTEENIFVRYGIVFEKDIFFLGRDQKGNNLIYRGTLNE